MTSEFFLNVLSAIAFLFIVLSGCIAVDPTMFNNRKIRGLFRITVAAFLAVEIISPLFGFDLHAISCSDILH